MSEYLATTLNEIFNIELNERVGYIITDRVTRVLLNRFYTLDQLVMNKVVGVFDIETMIDYQREDSMAEGSKRLLRENEMMYLVSLTKKNISHIEKQMKYFAMTVRIVFTTPPKDTDLQTIASVQNSELIRSVKSIPYDHMMFSDRAILSEELPPGVKTCYRVVFGRVDNPVDTNTSIVNRSKFIESLVAKSEDLFQRCHGRYTTLTLSIPREYDVVTPFITPWTYRSMIAYYLRIDHDLIYDVPFNDPKDVDVDNMLISTNNDHYFELLKNLQYDVLAEKVSSILKGLVETSNRFQTLLKEGKLTREMTHDMIKNKKSLTSARQHVKILERVNEYITQTDAVKMSELQVGILNGTIDQVGVNNILDTYCKTYHGDIRKNRPFRDVLNIYCIVFGMDIDFNDKYGILVSPFAKRFAKSTEEITERFATASDLIKKSTLNSVSNVALGFTDTRIFEQKGGQNTNAHNSKFKFNISITPRGLTLVDKSVNNPLAAHFPTIGALLAPFMDMICSKDCSNFRINPDIADLAKIQKHSNSVDPGFIKPMTFMENIVVHVNDFVTYEEIRVVEKIFEAYNVKNKVKFVIHSESLE